MSKRKLGKRTNHPPDGEPWIWHTLELLSSAAWCGRSVNCVRLINFLEAEHLRHGGNDNGNLLAPYVQLVAFGLGRRFINPAITEAEQHRLIRVTRGGRKGTVANECSRYRLTYHWSKTRRNGLWDWHEPTNDWQRFEASQKQNRCTFVQSDGAPSYTTKGAPS